MKIDENNHLVEEDTDLIWAMGLNLGPDSPIPQLRAQLLRENTLAAASDRLVLQEVFREVPLLTLRQPDKAKAAVALPSETLIKEGTPVLVIKENFDWYLIAVMRDPWQMGWVEKNAVRVITDFSPVVNDEHYLETSDSRHFPRIAPKSSGYGTLMKKLDPDARPPKYIIKYIIMHYTTGTRMESTINHFTDAASGVSTHLLIGRDGRVVQFLPFNRIGHHAGHSWWEMEKHLNTSSIGIELDNAGRLRKGIDDQGREVRMSRKTIIPDEHVKWAPHWKNLNIDVAWEEFPPVQLEVAKKIVKLLKETYDIQEILGHDYVNLLNREDPGPLFPMKDWREELFGRRLPAVKSFYLTQKTDLLTNYGAAPPNESTSLHEPGILPADSEVIVGKYDPEETWTKITVKQSRRAPALRNRNGWVRTSSLEPIVGKGQTGGRQMGKDRKAGNMGNKNPPPRPIAIRQFTVKNNQPFYKIAGGDPTPPMPFEAGTKVRKQEENGKWTLVVVQDYIKGETGFQGWVKTDLIAEKFPRPKAIPAALRSSVPLWQHKDDEQLSKLPPQLLKTVPSRPHPRGDPAVFPLERSAATRVDLTKQWQFFIRAINYGIEDLDKVSAIFGYLRAFTNLTGLGDPAHPRADFIKGENLSRSLPQLDKVRTCALSVMTGVVAGDHLVVEMMNGSQDPPLKDGCVYPERVEDVTIDIYKFTPQTHRHLFFAANITSRGGRKVSPFPNGGFYDWTGDEMPYTWMPHVAPGNFKVRYTLSYLTRLPPGAPIPSPYKALDDGMD